ncbi:MAG: hypothetical protein ACK5XN_07420, partial [Bacteroidota bacterium]
KYAELPAFVVYVIEWLQSELASMFKYNDPDNIKHHVNIVTQVLYWYRNNEMYAHSLLLARELLLTKALVNGVVRSKYSGKWKDNIFQMNKFVKKEVIQIKTAANNRDETMMNDFIRQSNEHRYVRLPDDTAHGYQYELRAKNLYPCKFVSVYLKSDIEFGKLVFDMRNDVGHGMGDTTDLLNANLILEVIDAIINDNPCAQPVVPSLS